MNTVAIILAIVVVLLFYILYKYFLLKSTELSKTASLNASNPAIPITNNPSSLRYAYGIWVFVNSWNTGVSKTIFARDKNIMVYLDSTAPVLKCDIAINGGTRKTLEITDNFPLQKWVHVAISVDNQYVDAYLDGKLIKSGRMVDGQNGPATPTSKDIIIGGGTTFDAYVSKFQHWAEPIDPQTVWSEYMSGNGQGRVKSFISSYGIDVSIVKDNIEQSKYSIF